MNVYTIFVCVLSISAFVSCYTTCMHTVYHTTYTVCVWMIKNKLKINDSNTKFIIFRPPIIFVVFVSPLIFSCVLSEEFGTFNF